MSPNTPPRVRGFDYRGPRQYFVTVCTHQRRRWFADGPRARAIAVQISPFFETRGFVALAYCLMPAVSYLLENPMRAGLVERVADYPWIGSSRFPVDQLLASAGG
jgi:hypothetical protein